MQEDQEIVSGNHTASDILTSLNRILDPKLSLNEALDQIVQSVHAAGHGEHVFLSRFDTDSQHFKAVAWHSTINPSNVSPEQKLMGDSYVQQRMVVINDLSKYNYRLRTGAARLALRSMVGIPLVTRQGLAGVLEVFSQETDNFTDSAIELISMFAKQAAVIIENHDYNRECKCWAIENQFFHEAQKLEHASSGMFLYRLGETLLALLNSDGIAVFGLETQTEYNVLQEVMAKGFSMQDIGRFKNAFSKEFMDRITNLSNDGSEHLIIKQPVKGISVAEDKLIYIVPVVKRRILHGVIVFYWKQANADVNIVSLEGFVKRIIGYVANVLDRKHLYSNIQRISFTDMLTDLANRRLFDYVLNREFDKAKRTALPLSLLLIDIDYFKIINDQHGHVIGDSVLEQLGMLMKKYFRSVDMPARYGGEEFAVILPETDQESAMLVAERFRTLVSQNIFSASNKLIKLTVSIGLGTHQVKSACVFEHVEALIHATDQALYKAKQLGRNRTSVVACYQD